MSRPQQYFEIMLKWKKQSKKKHALFTNNSQQIEGIKNVRIMKRAYLSPVFAQNSPLPWLEGSTKLKLAT